MADVVRPPSLAGVGLDVIWVLKALVGMLLFGLAFPLGAAIGPVRIVTVDVLLLPLAALFAFTRAGASLPRVKWEGAERAMGAAVGLMLLSSILSLQPAISFSFWLVWVRAAAIYVILAHLLTWEAIDSEWLLGIVQGVLGVLILIGLVQLLTGSAFGLVSNYVGGGERQGSAFEGTRRLSGTTPEANVYGQWVALFSTALNASIMFRSRHMVLIKLALVLAVEITLIGATLSRGNLIFFILLNLTLVVIWIRHSPPQSAILKLLGVLLGTAAFGLWAFVAAAGGGTLGQIASRFAAQDAVRVLQIMHGIELLQHPKILVAGSGFGSFYPALEAHGIAISPIERWHFADATTGIHNAFLLVATEAGTIVAGIFIWFSLSTVRCAFRGAPNVERPRWVTAALIAMVLSYVILPMQVYMSAVGYPTLLFLAIIAVLVRHPRRIAASA